MTETIKTDPPDLERVYREQRPDLVRLGFLLTGSREHAEDLVQAAFATACENWEQIDKPSAYLKRAVVNRANDLHRRRFRERGRRVSEPTTHIPEVDETWRLIKQLPPRQRIVIVLHFYEDMQLIQIAELLARPPSTIRSDLKRALDRLRKVIQ
ncbi:sigma-70 family RNA polymerase sigma factor [Actinomadura spongiicola]|uniref:Sigma-70 family RNA polymerase sigma factor n=1 Tax=Actinomadura spongiicola TaxID=2303421 RepID=A0A372G7P4_9ACTN|nr:sigma-70 family RNA polymerase sigma factor [Actinomadura spongiicola]RFS81410.1 sigma-70 family RNA polymerase sigma factor [Actinomadura spongiicola]